MIVNDGPLFLAQRMNTSNNTITMHDIQHCEMSGWWLRENAKTGGSWTEVQESYYEISVLKHSQSSW